MKDSEAFIDVDYRTFRQRILLDCPSCRDASPSWSEYDADESPHRYQRLRKSVREFREQVRRSVRQLMQDSPGHEPLIRRALGIPAEIPLIVERWSCIRHIGQGFVPLFLTWPAVQSLANQVRTYEGREYLFDTRLKRMLSADLGLFNSGIDLALRRLPAPSFEQLRALRSLDPEWMQVCFRVGVRSVAEMEPYSRNGNYSLAGELALMLVEEGVIARKEEFAWIKASYEWRSLQDHSREHLLAKSRRLVRVLRTHGIERQRIATIFEYCITSFDGKRCEANLAVVQRAGIEDLTALYDGCGEALWRSLPASWAFVTDTIGACSVAQVQSFKRLIDSRRQLSVECVTFLKSLGAGINELAECQSLILHVSSKDQAAPAIVGLNLLAGAPHLLSIQQLTQCLAYLSYPEQLPEYLQVLARFGYGSAASVLAFQKCYANSSAWSLERWMKVLGTRRDGELADVVDWVLQANKGANAEVYDYLEGAVPLPDFKHLQQVLPICVLGRQLLQFLVERKGMSSVHAIRHWYFKVVKGIQGFRWWGEADDVYLLLLEDAYGRNNFSPVEANKSCVRAVVEARCHDVMGSRLSCADDAARVAYDQAKAALLAKELGLLMPVLPKILDKTAGVVLKSVLRAAWAPAHVLDEKLAAINPLIDDLVAGRGPSGAQLSELEADAVSMLYRTAVDVVQQTWPEVVGQEHDLGGLKLQDHYAMSWDNAFRSLRVGFKLERQSLNGLAYAAAYSANFQSHNYENIATACKPLFPKRLNQAARDPWSLAAHLGVLLAAAREDSAVAHWISDDLDVVAQMAGEGRQAFERFEQLNKLFGSTLPDALDKHAERFLARFSEADALAFANRLVPSAEGLSGSGPEQLRAAFRLVRERVLHTCLRWVAREQAKFAKEKTENLSTALTATLSKHPAAFFAKHAAALCTGSNTLMWKEARHAHLVVFDPAHRRLAGMALVFIELIPALHRDKKCLIIRAINPMDDMLAAHTASSIVDAFFNVAIQIAEENSLAAVAFPGYGGADLLSNQDAIQKDIVKRYTQKTVNWTGRAAGTDIIESPEQWRRHPRHVGTTFFAYEQGKEKVSEVYAIWPGDALRTQQPVG